MGRKYALTWDKSRKRWKKKYRGEQHYFSFGDSKTDEEGYQLALQAWQNLKKQIDGTHEKDFKKAIDFREQILQWYADAAFHNDEESEFADWDYHFSRDIEQEVDVIEENQSKPNPLSLEQLQIHIDPLWGRSEVIKSAWQTRLPSLGRTGILDVAKHAEYDSVGKRIEMFIGLHKARVKGGQLSVSHFQTLSTRFQYIREFLGANTAAKQVNGKVLTAFHAHLLKELEKHMLSPIYARHLMAELRKFIKWLYSEEVLDELPRVLMADSRQFRFNVTPQAIEVFTVKELHVLLSNATPRTRLYLLLMMNCGMYQGDISDLKQTDVDWKHGRITRRRSKTSRQGSVPVVNYLLWKPTFELLQKFRSDDDTRVLVNRTGDPLLNRQLRENGTTTNFDNIRTAYERLVKKLKIKKPKTLKLIRKTSASMLEDHETYGRFVQYFLGHAPQTIAQKHYVKPSDELFDKAIIWLGEKYGISELFEEISKKGE